MATSKKTAKGKGAAGAETARAVSTAAFKHGASAYGARFVKKGFGFDDQEDLEWALGWPHVRRLVDGHPDDADPLGYRGAGFPVYDIDFPREQAARRVRFYLFCPSTREESKKKSELAQPFQEKAGPVTEEEARSVITQHLKPGANLAWTHYLPQIILLIEAFVGPQLVAEALVETVEACPPDVLTSNTKERFDCMSLLGFLLLRLPEPVRGVLETRLRKVLDAVVATIPGGLGLFDPAKEPWYAPFRVIDRVINGQEAVLRLGRNVYPTDLLFAEDPAFIVESLRGRPGPGDYNPALARLAFLGGEAVLDIEATWWSKYPEPREKDVGQRNFIRDYGRIRSEKMLAIFLAMSRTSRARKEAAAWFAAHAEYARPYLERTAAGSGVEAGWAKALLG
jgi:hypothetical protein